MIHVFFLLPLTQCNDPQFACDFLSTLNYLKKLNSDFDLWSFEAAFQPANLQCCQYQEKYAYFVDLGIIQSFRKVIILRMTGIGSFPKLFFTVMDHSY